jgi:hypothetical protein
MAAPIPEVHRQHQRASHGDAESVEQHRRKGVELPAQPTIINESNA